MNQLIRTKHGIMYDLFYTSTRWYFLCQPKRNPTSVYNLVKAVLKESHVSWVSNLCCYFKIVNYLMEMHYIIMQYTQLNVIFMQSWGPCNFGATAQINWAWKSKAQCPLESTWSSGHVWEKNLKKNHKSIEAPRLFMQNPIQVYYTMHQIEIQEACMNL